MTPASYRVIISKRAFTRLHAIFDHIRRDSPANAAQVITELSDAVQSLSELPHRYKVVQEHRDPAKSVRLMPVPPYVVYYRVDDKFHAVRVTTVLHGRQRRPRRF